MLVKTQMVGRNNVRPSSVAAMLGASYPIRQYSYVPIACNPCDNAADWSPLYATNSNDTVNYVCGGANKQSVKITISDVDTHVAGWMDYVYGSVQDFRDGNGNAPLVKVRFYVHEGSGASSYENINYVRIYFGDTDFTNFYSVVLEGADPAPGWHTVVRTPSMFDTTGTPAWNAIQKIRFRIEVETGDDTPSVTLDQIEFLQRMPKAIYMITFDDGKAGQYEVAAYLTSKGLRGTFYVITSMIGKAGYLTLDQIRQMHAAGHLIANHGWAHKYWANVSTADIIEDITKATEWLCDNGLADGARIYALPGGGANWKSEGECELLGRFVDSIRLTAMEVYNGKGGMWVHPGLLTTDPFDNVTYANNSLNNAISDGVAAIVGFHDKEKSGVYTQADLEGHIDNVATQRDSGNIEVITAADLLDERRFW